MISHLGEVAINAIGVAGKPMMIYSSVIGSVSVLTGIMLAQYVGRNSKRDIQDTLIINLRASLFIAGVFMLVCHLFAEQLISIYTSDPEVIKEGVTYLTIFLFSTIPIALTNLFATYFRTIEKSYIPLLIGVVAMFVDIILNYALIFGKLGFPEMGVAGAAIATLAAQLVSAAIIIVLFETMSKVEVIGVDDSVSKAGHIAYFKMFGGLVVAGLLFSISENIYAIVYGNMGTIAFAALCLVYPIMGIASATVSGFQSAAGVLVGKALSNGDKVAGYKASIKSLKYVGIISVCLSVLFYILSGPYLSIYAVEPETAAIARDIMLVYLIFLPFMMLNMVLSQAVLKSGGRIKAPLYADIFGMWCLGVPIALIGSAFFDFPIHILYMLVSSEQIVRLLICLVIMRRKGYLVPLEGISS